jgi:hypothetical protein
MKLKFDKRKLSGVKTYNIVIVGGRLYGDRPRPLTSLVTFFKIIFQPYFPPINSFYT